MCNPADPTVSIVVPCFNEDPSTIEAGLASLQAQTWVDFECLVIDESTDAQCAGKAKEVCDGDPRFVYIHPTDRLGLAASLNLGLSKARGSLIARFDSDDVCLPDRLALQVAFLQGHPDIGVVGGALEIMDDAGKTSGFRYYPLDHDAIASRMMVTNALAHPTVMFRRSLVESLGNYAPEFRYSEDLDLWLRWLNGGVRFANLPEVVLKYRQQSTVRNNGHWRFNLKARVRNFRSDRFVLRTLGICVVAAWTTVPGAIQDWIFRSIIFNKRKG